MRTRHHAFVVASLLVALLWVVPAGAQEQTGSIEGIVKDSSGSVLPGVTIEARSPSAVGVTTAITDGQGVYRFPALPPGTYTITATLSGFAPAKIQAQLVLGKLLKVDIGLAVAGVSETVQVTGEAPLIDTKQNAAFATITSDTIARIPKGRDFTSVVATAAGAQAEAYSGGLQIDGSSGSENRFIVDGMDTTALRSGTSNKNVMTDFIQEVQVKSSGYNAEFGGATGGVISAITKSGSNQLRGSGGIYYTANSLRPQNTSLPRYNPFDDETVEQVTTPVDPYTFWNPIADIGGPVIKDRLWFYAGYAYTRDKTDRTVTFLSSDNAADKRTYSSVQKNNYLNWNVNTQLSPNLRIKASGANQLQSSRGTLPGVLRNGVKLYGYSSVGIPDGTLGNGYSTSTWADVPDVMAGLYDQTGFDYVNNLYSGNIDWVLKPTLFANITAGSLRYNTTTPPEFAGTATRYVFSRSNMTYLPSTIPQDLRHPSGWESTKSSNWTKQALYGRAFLNANVIWYKSAGGQHTMKAGMRYERITQVSDDGERFPRIMLSWNASTTDLGGKSVRGPYGYFRVRQVQTIGDVHSNNFGFWVQDSWSINNRLTINAGVRTENEHVPTYTTTTDATGIDFSFRDKIAPRLGFAYDVKGDSVWKVYGSYAHYFDITKLSLPMGSFGADKWIDYYFTLDTYDWKSINCTDGMKGTGCTGGTLIKSRDMRYNSSANDPRLVQYGVATASRSAIDPNLKPYQSREYVFGMDHEINKLMSFGVRYKHSWLVRAIEDVGRLLPFGELYFISNPGYGDSYTILPDFPDKHTPPATRKYDGVDFSLKRRLANRWQAEINYTISRLWGNYSGLAASDEEGRTDPNNNRSFDSLYQSFNDKGEWSYGLLKTDRAHVVKVSASYDLPFGTSVGVFGIVQSGIPWSSYMDWQGYSPVFYADRGNMGRTPTYKRIDLQLQHEVALGRNRRMILQGNVDNLFNFKTVADYWENKWRDPLEAYDDSVFFAGFNAEQLVSAARADGYTIRDNALFGKAYSVQPRRAVRVAAKFVF